MFFLFFFFFNDTATTEIYTLSLHDALPISLCVAMPLPSTDSFTSGHCVCTAGCDEESGSGCHKPMRRPGRSATDGGSFVTRCLFICSGSCSAPDCDWAAQFSPPSPRQMASWGGS